MVAELLRNDQTAITKTNGTSEQNGRARRHARALGWFSLGLGVAEIAAPSVIARLVGARANARTKGLLRALGLREVASGLGIFSASDSPRWVFSRVLGDAIDLALLAEIVRERPRQRGRALTALAAVAGVSVLDALTTLELARAWQEPEAA